MKKTKLIALFLALGLSTAPAWAGEKEQLETLRQTTLNLIKALVQAGALTQAAADQLIRDAEKSAAQTVAAQGKAEAGVVRVPYVPEVVKQEIREQLKNEVMAQAKSEGWATPGSLPSWLGRIAWSGDMRLRYQNERWADDNTPASQVLPFAPYGVNLASTTEDQKRLRVRARLAMQAKVSDNVSAGVRVSTGTLDDPVSTNQTLGNNFNKYSLVVDQAYLKLAPYNWLSVSGGRMPNPWLGTELVWDEDLNFEGVAATLKPQFRDDFSGFLTVGVFPVQHIAPSDTVSANNRWLYGTQAGLEWNAADTSKVKLGLGLYDYRNVEGVPNVVTGDHFYDKTQAGARQKGNSVVYVSAIGDPDLFGLASKFRELNLTAVVDVAAFDPVHVVFSGDFVKNLGFDKDEILRRTGDTIEPRTKGYQAKLTVGMPKMEKYGDWQVFTAYKHLERDAVLDAFTDSDFHLGGTDTKGYILGGSYGIDKNTWFTLRWLSADPIDGPPLAIDVLQVDLNAKF
jgi:hypothetical protein